MNEILQKIIEKLKEKEIEFNLIQLKDRAMTVYEVIKFSDGNLNPKEICKTLILKDQKNNLPVIASIKNVKGQIGNSNSERSWHIKVLYQIVQEK